MAGLASDITNAVNFGWRSMRRAVKDTIQFFGADLKSALLVVIPYISGAYLDFEIRGKEAVMEELWVSAAWWLIPVGVMALIIFSFNLILAPSRLFQENKKTLDSLNEKIEDFNKPRFEILEPAVVGTQYAKYVQAAISNISGVQIDSCEAHLRKIIKTLPNGESCEANIGSPIRLVTSEHHLLSTAVYPGVPIHFDLANGVSSSTFAIENSSEDLFGIASTVINTSVQPDFFHDVGEYDFYFAITGDDVPTVNGVYRVSWNGEWHKLTASKLSGDR